MRFCFIRDHRSHFSVKRMCRTLKVSKSGYYAWVNRRPSRRTAETTRLRSRIFQLYEEHSGCAGSPMITADLRAETEFRRVSRQRVARHMRQLGLRCQTSRRFVVTTDSKHAEPIAPNRLNRQFTVSFPNTAWVTDITYLKVGRKWNYLTVFIDLFSRIVVGWDLSDSLERHSAIRAFRKAFARRRPPHGLLIHSDRGIQFASHDFRSELRRHGCVQSMSRKGNCWDNAVAESFFHTLKTQFVRHRRFSNSLEAELALFQYIEAYYNRRRKHSSNGWISPAEFEKQLVMKEVA